MGQVHELQADRPVRPGRCVSPVALVLGVAGAIFGALALSIALSALFAHPAEASTLPLPSRAPAIGALSPVAQSGGAVLNVVEPDNAAPASNATSLAPVIEPISRAIAPPLGLVVTTLRSLPATAPAAALPFAPPVTTSRVEPVTDGATVRTVGISTRTPASPPAFDLQPRPGPGSPAPLPIPAWPFHSFPLATSSSATGDSSPSAGSALAAAPISGPLLPDPPVSGVIPEQSAIPRFLFDLRSSPPG